MEELAVMQLKVIEPYHKDEKYPQIEDLVRDAGVMISKSTAELIQEYFSKKASGKDLNADVLTIHLNSVLQYVLALMYVFEFDTPGEEDLEEHIEDEIAPLINQDVILTLFNIQNRISQITLDYWIYADSEDGFNSHDMYMACMDIIGGLKILCEKYKIDFIDLIFV